MRGFKTPHERNRSDNSCVNYIGHLYVLLTHSEQNTQSKLPYISTDDYLTIITAIKSPTLAQLKTSIQQASLKQLQELAQNILRIVKYSPKTTNKYKLKESLEIAFLGLTTERLRDEKSLTLLRLESYKLKHASTEQEARDQLLLMFHPVYGSYIPARKGREALQKRNDLDAIGKQNYISYLESSYLGELAAAYQKEESKRSLQEQELVNSGPQKLTTIPSNPFLEGIKIAKDANDKGGTEQIQNTPLDYIARVFNSLGDIYLQHKNHAVIEPESWLIRQLHKLKFTHGLPKDGKRIGPSVQNWNFGDLMRGLPQAQHVPNGYTAVFVSGGGDACLLRAVLTALNPKQRYEFANMSNAQVSTLVASSIYEALQLPDRQLEVARLLLRDLHAYLLDYRGEALQTLATMRQGTPSTFT